MSNDYEQIMESAIPGVLLIGTAIGMLGAVAIFQMFSGEVQYLGVAGWVVLASFYGAHKARQAARIERESGLVEAGDS